jgi:hypothetical protein
MRVSGSYRNQAGAQPFDLRVSIPIGRCRCHFTLKMGVDHRSEANKAGDLTAPRKSETLDLSRAYP